MGKLRWQGSDAALRFVNMRRMIGLGLLLAIGPCAKGQDNDSTAFSGMKWPYWWTAKYPSEAERAGLEGTVVLNVTLDTLCQIQDKRIVEDIGVGCGEAALESIDGKFELALMQSNKFKCVTGSHPVLVHFKLEE